MEANLRTLVGVLSLTCLFHSSLSDIKSKLIVKVPHRIRHIHISHLKPVHVHTVESEKFHHHHHEEGGLAHVGLRVKDKEQHSSSNIKPIVWSPELHLEDMKRPEGALAFTLGNKPKTHYTKRTKHFTKNNRMQFKQPNSYKKDHWQLSPHIFQSADEEDSQHAFSNQEWLRFDENVLRNKKNRGFSRGFRQSKGNYGNPKGKHMSLEQDESGWTPMLNFEDIINDKNNFKIHHDDQFFNSDSLDNGKDSSYSKKHTEITIPKRAEKGRMPQKNNAKGSWSNRFEQDYKKVNTFLSQGGVTHQKPQSNLGDDLHSLEPSSFKYLKDSLLRDIEAKNPMTSSYQQKPLSNLGGDLHSLEPSNYKYLKDSLLRDIETKNPRTSSYQQKPLSNLGGDLHSLEPSNFKYLKDSLLRDIETKNPRTSSYQQKPLSNLESDLHSVEPSSFKYLKDSLLREVEHENPRASSFQQKPLQIQKPEHHQVNVQTKQPKQQERRTQKKRLQPDVHQQTQQKQNSHSKVHQQEWPQQTVHQPTNHQQQFVHGHVLSAPVQEIIVNHKSTKNTPLSSASLIKTPPSHKHRQANSGIIEVNPQTPEVKWHQSVQTGKDGTGSYKFEVIKSSPSAKVTPGI